LLRDRDRDRDRGLGDGSLLAERVREGGLEVVARQSPDEGGDRLSIAFVLVKELPNRREANASVVLTVTSP